MKASALQSIFWILLIFCNAVHTQPQTKTTRKEPASSVSGRVTIKGKGAPGIVVGMRADLGGYSAQWAAPYKAATDQDGNYKITNVVPGSYRIMPEAPAFVNSGDRGAKTLLITAGETLEGMDFTLTLGGVITGKAVDSEGLPLIEEQVTLLPAEANTQIGRYLSGPSRIQTDDRGIYRIFGIPPGRYKIAVGQSEDGSFGGPRRSLYKQTFSPAVTDSSKASIIEVTEGSETANVDITVGRSLATFAVSGRIVKGETLQAEPNLRLSLHKITGDGISSYAWASTSNSQGGFKIENVTPGRYFLSVAPQPNSGVRSDSVRLEVVDQDVSGLLVKTSEGSSVSGLIVLEGRNDRTGQALLHQVQVQIFIANAVNDDLGGGPIHSATINSDGSFQFNGLQAGLANFSLTAANRGPITGLTLVRVERDGVDQSHGVEIKDGEKVTGVRIVVSYGNGSIRGVVRIENGEMPANARFFVGVSTPGGDSRGVQRTIAHSSEVDSRGHFLIEGLPAGTYEVRATLYIPNSRTRPPSVTQQVSVTDGTVTEVSLNLNQSPAAGSGNP